MRKWIWLFGSLIALSIAAGAEEKCEPLTQESDLKFSDIQSLIERCGIRSNEELVPRLPQSYRKHFTLMHQSRALFGPSVSAGFPRVISFGKDAKLIVAFNGDPSRPGHNTLEAIEFDSTAARFTMHRVDFPGKESKDKARFHAPNPPVCLSCHGMDPKPLWESYDLWPGAYGANDDTIDPAGEEGKNYLAFLAGARQSANYRHFSWKNTSPVYPFSAPGQRELNVTHTPNARLTLLLNGLNAQRIARKLVESPKLAQDPARAVRKLLGCETLAQDPTYRPQANHALEKKRKRHGNPLEGRGFGQTIESIDANWRLELLANDLGVDGLDFPMMFIQDGYFFADGLRPILTLVLGSLTERISSSEDPRMKVLHEFLAPYQSSSAAFGKAISEMVLADQRYTKKIEGLEEFYDLTGAINSLGALQLQDDEDPEGSLKTFCEQLKEILPSTPQS